MTKPATKQPAAHVVKLSTTEKPKSAGARAFTFRLSSGELDRDHDRIEQLGIETTEYRKNPVVLWAHDHSRPPIGKMKSIVVRQGALTGTIEFAPRGVSGLADEVHDLVDAGFVNAVSIGFRPLDFAANEDGGFNFTKVELTEVSVVPVPANPAALRVAAAKRLPRSTLDAARRLLEIEPDPPPAITIDPGELEGAVKRGLEQATARQTLTRQQTARIARSAARGALRAQLVERVCEETGCLDESAIAKRARADKGFAARLAAVWKKAETLSERTADEIARRIGGGA